VNYAPLRNDLSTKDIGMSIDPTDQPLAKAPTGTRRGVALYAESPFMAPGTMPTRMKRITNKKGDMTLISNDTGEVISPVAGFWESKIVDSEAFVKLYVKGVKALAELSTTGTKLFEILYREMSANPGKDKVYLSFTMLTEEEKKHISVATWTRGMAELMQKRFLAATTSTGWYWTNPSFAFNGDRITFAQSYRRNSPAGKAEIQGQQSLFIEGGVEPPPQP
jgi:hypothetical protein